MATATVNTAGMNVAQMFSLGKPVTIASIFPLEQSIMRRFKTKQDGGHLTVYRVDACTDRTQPTLLVIGDAMEHQFLGTANGKGSYMDVPVAGGAMAIAEDFITNTRKAAGGQTDGAAPGIWICAGERPTQEEIAYWNKSQTNYFNKFVYEADDKWFNGQKEAVGSFHRVAAAWLNVDPTQHEWVNATITGDTVQCPFCSTRISSTAIKCSTCNEVVDVDRYMAHTKRLQEAKAALAEQGITVPEVVAPVKPVPNQPIHPPTQRK